MSATPKTLDEEVLHLYQEPAIGSGYSNMYGEENIVNLVEKYCSLDNASKARMQELIVGFSESTDLSSSFVSVAVLHALGMKSAVQNAYRLAEARDEAQSIKHHFDIGISLADHFIGS
ncbi:MAG: hypothetical protein NPINA01_03910 [Nitrospinaceae bacterium]|nr:MAG: hypothetical protein NPINA01_03910 [Nitrospinaceae bacterium]